MEDVYLAQKRNVNGGVFGFVRYGHVKDVNKLLKAVNNVWFGDWRVVAKVASFDWFGNKRDEGKVKGERGKNIEGEKRKVVGRNGYKGEKSKNGYEGEKRNDVGYAQVVRGEETSGETVGRRVVSGKVALEVVNEGKMFFPKYTSSEQDVLWARKGVVATVLNGEAILVLQHRIFDAGVEQLDLIPMGADKVLLRMEDDRDVSSVLSDGADFFLILSSLIW